MNTPLQYHALVEEKYSDDPYIINPLMDDVDARQSKVGEDYTHLSLGNFNFARADIADHLWGDM